MKSKAAVLLFGLTLGCAARQHLATARNPSEESAIRTSSCSVSCEIEGRPVSGKVTCHEGFTAVCSCESLPNASCRPVAGVAGGQSPSAAPGGPNSTAPLQGQPAAVTSELSLDPG